MIRRKLLLIAFAAILVVPSLAPVTAADDVLSIVPEDALGFAVINGLADVDKKFQDIGKAIGVPAMPPMLDTAKLMTGLSKGLDEKGSGVVVFLAPEDTDIEPVVVMAAPVTDYKKFLAELNAEDAEADISKVTLVNAPFVVANKGGFALIAQSKHRGRLEEFVASTGKPAESLAPLKSWIAENDAVAVMMPAGVKLSSYLIREQIKSVGEMMGQMGDEMAPAAAVFEVYGQLFAFMGKEVSMVAGGLRVDEQGTVHLSSRTRFTEGGSAAKSLAQIKPAEGDLLAGLPGGPFVFAGGGIIPEALMKGMMDFGMDMMKTMPGVYGLDEEQVDEMAKASTKTMDGIRSMSMMLGPGKPGDPIYSNVISIMKVDSAKTFMDNYQDYSESITKLGGDAESSFLKDFKIERIDLDGTEVLKLQMGIPMGPGMDMPEMKDMFEKLFGPGAKMTIFIAVADEETVVMVYGNRRVLRQALKAAKSGEAALSADEQVAETAGMLPEGAQWLGYWSPKGTVAFVNRVIPMFDPSGDSGFQLPNFPKTAPIGCAAKVADGELQTEMIVPGSVIKALAQFVAGVQQIEM